MFSFECFYNVFGNIWNLQTEESISLIDKYEIPDWLVEF